MATAQPVSSPLSFGLDDVQYGIRVKCPKLALGPLELGIAATYSATGSDDEEKKLSLTSSKRFKASLTVKDIFLRGKFEVEPQERKLHYSKKFRLPFLNTELLKLRLTTQLPASNTSGGLLGRVLGLTVSFQPERLHNISVVRKAPAYALQLAPRVGPPQVVYDKVGFPGSIYLKGNTTLQLSDGAAVSDLRAHLDVHSVTAVVRLYDTARVKPCRLGRNLAHAARRLTLEDAEEEEEARHVRAAVKVARVLEAEMPEPDIIDQAAGRVREWAHAVLVNSCVATRHLQDRAALATEHIRSTLAGKSTASTSK